VLPDCASAHHPARICRGLSGAQRREHRRPLTDAPLEGHHQRPGARRRSPSHSRRRSRLRWSGRSRRLRACAREGRRATRPQTRPSDHAPAAQGRGRSTDRGCARAFPGRGEHPVDTGVMQVDSAEGFGHFAVVLVGSGASVGDREGGQAELSRADEFVRWRSAAATQARVAWPSGHVRARAPRWPTVCPPGGMSPETGSECRFPNGLAQCFERVAVGSGHCRGSAARRLPAWLSTWLPRYTSVAFAAEAWRRPACAWRDFEQDPVPRFNRIEGKKQRHQRVRWAEGRGISAPSQVLAQLSTGSNSGDADPGATNPSAGGIDHCVAALRFGGRLAPDWVIGFPVQGSTSAK
jgi:hypothetical protein